MKTEVNASSSDTVKPDSLQAWLLAVRPRTLSASATPVLVACAYAFACYSFRIVPAVLCFVFAILAQIASNLANDYFDYKSGSDSTETRIGPARAVASGWISPSRMRAALAGVVAVACLFGLGLVFYGGWQMIIVGVACVVALLAYSAGPFPASRHGLGDVFVLLFYGYVPVFFTFYLVSGYAAEQVFSFLSPTAFKVFLLASAVAFPSVNILVLNNFRDYYNDKAEGKRTTVVMFGRRFALGFYLVNGIIALLCVLLFFRPWSEYSFSLLVFLGYLFAHVGTLRGIARTAKGPALNRYLGQTSRNLMILAVFICGTLIVYA
jgi:1,4-dihydroxy-2-naphthoate octaprenyltransferase